MRRAGLVIAVLTATVMLAACVPTYEGVPGTPRVAFVSDSVLGMADDVMIPNLRLDHQVSWTRTNAARVAALQGYADEVVATNPDTVVISAGTNDVFGHLDPATTIAELKAMVAKFSGSCVTLVTLNTNVLDADVQDRSQQVNDWIRTWPQVADWDAWVTGYYAAGQPAGQIFYDLIHVVPAAKGYLTDVVNSAVRRCLNRGWPLGYVDSAASPSAGTVRVSGWVLDPDTTDPIQAHVYVDGVFAAATTADDPRPDVAAALPFGPKHGFSVTVDASKGTHEVCVYGIGVGQGGNNRLPCRTATVG